MLVGPSVRVGGQPHPHSALRQCTRELSRALRAEYFTDASGHRVRAKHPVSKKGEDGQQMVLWDDIRTAPRGHMEISFQQRRKRIVGDCRQLKTDAESYSTAHADESPIQVEFDFTRDLRELELVAAASTRPQRWSSPSSTGLEPRAGLSQSVDLDSTSLPSPYPH